LVVRHTNCGVDVGFWFALSWQNARDQFGARDVLMAVHRCVLREGGALLQGKLLREERERREREEKRRLEEETAGDEEWLVSDGEMDFGFEDEEEEEGEIDYVEEGSEIAQYGGETSDEADA
jgi:hypothetical protein